MTKTARQEHAILWVCQTCMVSREHAEDVRPEGSDEPEPWALLGKDDWGRLGLGLYREDHADTCENREETQDRIECDCEEDPFSTASCDGCGSWLHGDRYAYTLDES